ncbi:hypothetical protein C8J55DRAFT_490089 [Lentinula edodes]|uniref:Uncharacterized protein n=1 Tax=Lentinula lateritia TaxID=40482 RepID=A0A9W9A8N1_9AGAR|nr:hypothetical protein C8J55DRAFT_490089 [Lentinula edodes]
MLSSIVFLATFVTLTMLSSASPVPVFDSASSPSNANSTLIISGPSSSIPLVSRGNEQSTPGVRTTKKQKHRDNRNHRKKVPRWPQDITYVDQLLREGHEIFGYSFVPVDVTVPSLSDLRIPALRSSQSSRRLEHLFRVPPVSTRGCRTCIVVSHPDVRQRLNTNYGMVFHLIPPYNPSTSIEFSETDQQFNFVDNTQDYTVMYLPQPAVDEEKRNFHIACHRIGEFSGHPSTWVRANWAGWGIENWPDGDYNIQSPPQYTE